MTQSEISNFIDNRNSDLWVRLNQEYDISIENSFEDSYMCYTKDKTSTIYILENNYCKDSFTHELLHVYLKSKGILIGNYISINIESNEILSLVITKALIEHIGNCLEHIKMFPVYLGLGFNKEKFISDYYTAKCTEEEIDYLANNFKFNYSTWTKAVDYYIAKFFAIKSCPNNSINYNEFLLQLNSIDSDLFNILNDFWKSWESYSIENNTKEYELFCDKFMADLKAWVIQMAK